MKFESLLVMIDTNKHHLAGGIGKEGDSADTIFNELQSELQSLSERPLTIVVFGASGM